jgi:hypothetical protein
MTPQRSAVTSSNAAAPLPHWSTAGAWECRTRSRSCLDYANQGVRASACAHAAERSRSRPRSSAKAARRRGVERAAPPRPPAKPSIDPGPTTWLARVAQRNWAAHARRNRPAPAMVAAQRFDHRRSPTVHAVSGSSSIDHPPLGGAAEAERRDTKEATPRLRRAAAPSPGSEGRRLCHAEPHPVRQPPEPVNPARTTQRQTAVHHEPWEVAWACTALRCGCCRCWRARADAARRRERAGRPGEQAGPPGMVRAMGRT